MTGVKHLIVCLFLSKRGRAATRPNYLEQEHSNDE